MLAWFNGIGTSTAKKSFIFVILQGESRPPAPPSGSVHAPDMSAKLKYFFYYVVGTQKNPLI